MKMTKENKEIKELSPKIRYVHDTLITYKGTLANKEVAIPHKGTCEDERRIKIQLDKKK